MVLYEVRDRIAWITLNRPDKRNALNADMVSALKEALSKAEADSTAKIIVIKASGKSFCSGADLASLEKMQSNSYEQNLTDSTHLAELFQQIYRHPKVIIAQIQGAAIAGGCGLATVCDFSVASDNAKFGYSEARIGFVPAIVMIYLINKIGEGKARELLLSAAIIDANIAQQFGLINHVVPSDQLEARVLELGRSLVEECSSDSLRTTKEMLSKLQRMSVEDAVSFAAQMNARARSSEDCKRGIQAFLNKEKISW